MAPKHQLPPPVQAVSDAAITREIEGELYGTRHMDPEKILRHAGKLFGLSASQVMALTLDAQIMEALKDCFDLAMVNGRELGPNKGNYWKVHFLGKQAAFVQFIAFCLETHFIPFFAAARKVYVEIKTSLDDSDESSAASKAE